MICGLTKGQSVFAEDVRRPFDWQHRESRMRCSERSSISSTADTSCLFPLPLRIVHVEVQVTARITSVLVYSDSMIATAIAVSDDLCCLVAVFANPAGHLPAQRCPIEHQSLQR